MEVVTINVTEKDIEKGRPVVCTGCPVALAIKRRIKPQCEVIVGATSVNIFTSGHEKFWIVDLPRKAQYFIEDFDEDRDSVDPIKFKLELPREVLP